MAPLVQHLRITELCVEIVGALYDTLTDNFGALFHIDDIPCLHLIRYAAQVAFCVDCNCPYNSLGSPGGYWERFMVSNGA